jgi:hypothetical protein
MLMFRMSNLTEQDTTYFFIENQIRILNEGSSFNLLKFENPESELSNYIVNDGDILLIPKEKKTIFVFGQVAQPGHIDYKEGSNYNYYLNEAGGVGEYSDDEIMLIKGDTRNWIPVENDNYKIEAGDFIWVPKDPVRSFDYHISRLSNYLSIIGSIATIMILVIQLGK